MSELIEVVGSLTDKARADKCTAEIQALLKRYNCSMNPMITFKTTGMLYQVEIMALPNLPNPMEMKRP
jgi:hypothetical protein